MLVLSRRYEDRVFIIVPGLKEKICVTIVEIRSDKVRLGFDGPKHVTFLREELFDELKNQQA